MVSKMYLIRVLFFVGDVRFNVRALRGEHVPDCFWSKRIVQCCYTVSQIISTDCLLNVFYKLL